MMRHVHLERRAALRRTRLKKQGRRAKKAAALVLLLRAFREGVLRRSGGRCERCGWKPREAHLIHAHHVVPRSRAQGETWAHDPDKNGAALCSRCHGAVHDHTASDWRRWLR